ncbi:MAG: metal ABC transporter substrate-binding protein [Fibrobacterales bacterium]
MVVFRTLVLSIFILSISLATIQCSDAQSNKKSRLHITVSTYSVYELVNELIQDVPGITLELLVPGNKGCSHNYVLTPQNMMTLNTSELLVLNGFGMEMFITDKVLSQYPKLDVVEGSAGIPDSLVHYEGIDQALSESHSDHHDHLGHKEGEIKRANAHYLLSPMERLYSAQSIGKALMRIDTLYTNNYQTNLDSIQQRHVALNTIERVSGAKPFSVITQDALFAYLLPHLNITIVGTLHAHDGARPTLSELKVLIDQLKGQTVNALFVEKEMPSEVLETLSREVSVPAIQWESTPQTISQNEVLGYYKRYARNMKRLNEVIVITEEAH